MLGYYEIMLRTIEECAGLTAQLSLDAQRGRIRRTPSRTIEHLARLILMSRCLEEMSGSDTVLEELDRQYDLLKNEIEEIKAQNKRP